MVKGVSKQVIVVHSPDPKLFDQAIFILKDDAEGVTYDMLLREAKKLIGSERRQSRGMQKLFAPAWAGIGAAVTALIWLLSSIL